MDRRTTPRDRAKQSIISGNRRREALCGHPSGLFVHPFARPENHRAAAAFLAPLLVTSGNQVGRKLRSQHFKAVDYGISPPLAALLASNRHDSEISRHGNL